MILGNKIKQIIKYLVLYSFVDLIIFLIFLVTIAKDFYKIYVEYFQNGNFYEGETAAIFYLDFLELSLIFISIIVAILFYIFVYKK